MWLCLPCLYLSWLPKIDYKAEVADCLWRRGLMSYSKFSQPLTWSRALTLLGALPTSLWQIKNVSLQWPSPFLQRVVNTCKEPGRVFSILEQGVWGKNSGEGKEPWWVDFCFYLSSIHLHIGGTVLKSTLGKNGSTAKRKQTSLKTTGELFFHSLFSSYFSFRNSCRLIFKLIVPYCPSCLSWVTHRSFYVSILRLLCTLLLRMGIWDSLGRRNSTCSGSAES